VGFGREAQPREFRWDFHIARLQPLRLDRRGLTAPDVNSKFVVFHHENLPARLPDSS
jgi:hypothetical protein